MFQVIIFRNLKRPNHTKVYILNEFIVRHGDETILFVVKCFF